MSDKQIQGSARYAWSWYRLQITSTRPSVLSEREFRALAAIAGTDYGSTKLVEEKGTAIEAGSLYVGGKMRNPCNYSVFARGRSYGVISHVCGNSRGLYRRVLRYISFVSAIYGNELITMGT